MQNVTTYLMAGTKELPKQFVFTKFFDQDTFENHPGLDPVVSRAKPTVYTRDDDEDGIYYVNKEDKDCFFFQKTAFGWTANICDADWKNLDMEEDFKRAIYEVCDQFTKLGNIISTN